MRILLAPIEVAGVANALRAGLRERGHDAELAVFAPHPFGLPHDRLVSGYLRRAVAGAAAPLRYDVLHYQFGTTLAEFADAAWAHVVGRPLVLMHYWGSDCRLPEVTRAQHPARARVSAHGDGGAHTTRRRLRTAGRLCTAAIVSDLELLAHVRPYFRTVYVVPTPIQLPRVAERLPPLPGDGPIVFHAPSRSAIKGTAQIVTALEALAAERPMRTRLLTGIPHEHVLAEIARADIVVNQLNSETPGVFALEAMALGRPVVLEYRRDMLAPFAQATPLVAATPATLGERVAELCADAERRAELGRRGVEYVRDVHDARGVAAAIEHVYAHARTRTPGVFEGTAAGVRSLAFPPHERS